MNYEENIPEEQGSTGEDFLLKEEMDDTCPTCGSTKIDRVPSMTERQDFVWQCECLGCGTTWEI